MSVTTKALWAVQHLAELAAVGGYLYAWGANPRRAGAFHWRGSGAALALVLVLLQGSASLGALSESDDQSYRTLQLISVHLALYAAGACAAWALWVLLSRSARTITPAPSGA